jgi:Domain of unknown function (DUF4263)
MDDVLFDDGTRRLRISISGADRTTGAVTRDAFGLNVYAFQTSPTIQPLFTHTLNIEEARRLHGFLGSISLVTEENREVSGRFIEVDVNVSANVLQTLIDHPNLADDPEFVCKVLEMNPEVCRAVLETRIVALNISSFAYRRDQLEIMRRLLHDQDYFSDIQRSIGVIGKEAVWQNFFEKNQWIFGYALNYVMGEGVRPERLEQVVAGYSIATAGKRVDALLQTRGLLRSLCYVEIKTHDTALLHSSPYRSDVWQPSHELAGAVAQSQKTVQLAVEHLGTSLNLSADAGHQGERKFFNYSPRSVVVCGNLHAFIEDGDMNIPKFSSFELYRRSLHSPEIVTFDELLDRASAIVESAIAMRV